MYSFQTIIKAVSYISIWGGLVIIHVLTMMPLIHISIELLILDGFVFSSLLIIIGLAYKILIKSKSPDLVIYPQTSYNYISLGLFFIILWLGSGLFIMNIILTHNNFNLLAPTIPVRILVGLLIYTIAAVYDYFSSHKEIEEENIDCTDDCKEVCEEVCIEANKEGLLPEDNSSTNSELLEHIAVKYGQKIQVILIPDIFYLQSDGDYVIIFTEKGKYIKEQTMKFFEEHLPRTKFVRIHRSCIVNIEMISRIELYKKQQQMLTLKNGHQIKASTNGYKALKSVLQL
ncbi:LytTR family DNA-binding domain-containing protein [uncultured Bacteroides sp.]|uniref:LytR/AlgR family response regulator transcription factor n=1 Tax=uncultured Bacteroides sp. TaxID=162156 RepID=UPI002AAAE62D|nr:LytTR family DNA-binding domain-containing protein [uncultured Bacteroides sp.]